MKKMPVNMKEKELPGNGYKVCYDFRKRTSGGFVDAIILGGVLLTAVMWLMLFIVVGR